MKPSLTLFLFLAFPAVAAGTQVHKCRDAWGGTAFRSERCDVGERSVRTWDATPEESRRVTRDPDTRVSTVRTRAPRVSRAGNRARGAQPVDACTAAKQRRDEVERRVGLARTYELLSSLQRDVYDACR